MFTAGIFYINLGTSKHPSFGTLSLSSKFNENPIIGKVIFHLHPTFHLPVREVDIIDGKAKLTLISYGSFTVGAECEGSKMELDLAELEGVSEEFRNN